MNRPSAAGPVVPASVVTLNFPREAQAAYAEDSAMRWLSYGFVGMSVAFGILGTAAINGVPVRGLPRGPIDWVPILLALFFIPGFSYLAFFALGRRVTAVRVDSRGFTLQGRWLRAQDIRVPWAAERRCFVLLEESGALAERVRAPEARIRGYQVGPFRPTFCFSPAALEAILGAARENDARFRSTVRDYGPEFRVSKYEFGVS